MKYQYNLITWNNSCNHKTFTIRKTSQILDFSIGLWFFICCLCFSKYFSYFLSSIFWMYFFPFNCRFSHFDITIYNNVVWLQARGPHGGLPQCFQWPLKAFRKNLQIWYLLISAWGHIWIKCIFTKAIPFLCTILFYTFILWSNQKVYGPPLIPWLDNLLCFLGVPCLEEYMCGPMNSIPPNKSVYLSAESGFLKVTLEPN